MKSWNCPNHPICEDYKIIDKSQEGIWWLKVLFNCGDTVRITKHGSLVILPGPIGENQAVEKP